eukprot:NODE_668_length_5368_cov_0.471626.p4 type:complete len:113 gc:universal NODE_668_length_5368_cov_0.471626:627-965(+)
MFSKHPLAEGFQYGANAPLKKGKNITPSLLPASSARALSSLPLFTNPRSVIHVITLPTLLTAPSSAYFRTPFSSYPTVVISPLLENMGLSVVISRKHPVPYVHLQSPASMHF